MLRGTATGSPGHGVARVSPATRPAGGEPLGQAAAWRLLLAVRAAVKAGSGGRELAFTVTQRAIVHGADGASTVLVETAAGRLASGSERFDRAGLELLEQLLPLATAPRQVCAVLGQTLDGYIATADGESRYINGAGGLVHLHRLRALSDAVLVGASTAVLDQPRLTTRHVEGPSPVRVVIDPRGRLPATSSLLHDGAAPTLVLRAGTGAEQRLSEQARVVHLGETGECIPPERILAVLSQQGLGRLLIEGGGRTVSRFLASGLLDRLQLLVAPVILGSGRPAVCLPPFERLAAALRPACRRYLLPEDVLFDLDLRPAEKPLATCAGGG